MTNLITEARELCDKWSLSDYAVFECEDCIANMVIYKVVELCDALEKYRWIPVTERLPREDCIIYEANAGRVWFSYAEEVDAADWNITHWRPLPAPPEEGG